MPHALFGPEVREMLADKDADGLRSLCDTLHPATVAEALDDEFTPEQVWEVISPSDIRTQAAIFEYLPLSRQVEMIEGTAHPQVGQLIGKMSHDDRVDLLRRLPTRVKESLMRLVDDADRRDIATLVNYGENTVGALMTTDYAWLPPTLTTAEAIDQLRQQAPDRETIYYIYVLDEPRRRTDGGVAPRRLLGIISLRDLILAPRHTLIRNLMDEEIVALKYTDDRSVAAELLARYDFIAVPVLDETGGLVGIVTHDDVIDVLRAEATEDLQRQAGVSPLGTSYSETSFFRLWRSRAQWLAVLFVAELGTFTVMAYFQDALATVVVLSLFVPLCISTGGNSGTQASTLITRALALGDIKLADWKRILRRELLLGIALGLTLGSIAFLRGAATPADTRSGPQEIKQPFAIRVPKGTELTKDEAGDVVVPSGMGLAREVERPLYVRLPKDSGASTPTTEGEDSIYRFPANCEVRTQPVDRWKLGYVIALSVLGICLWGTIVGSTLPLVFTRLGLDPAVASGPFVATFVDITGIAIFFSIASAFLL